MMFIRYLLVAEIGFNYEDLDKISYTESIEMIKMHNAVEQYKEEKREAEEKKRKRQS